MLLLSLSNLAGEIILPTGIKHIKLFYTTQTKRIGYWPYSGPISSRPHSGPIQIRVRFSPRQPRRGTMGSVLGRGRLKSLYAELEIETEILNIYAIYGYVLEFLCIFQHLSGYIWT